MFELTQPLKDLGCEVEVYSWSSYLTAEVDMNANASKQIVVIGYSGGGSRATWIKARIDLMVLYDPSPRWQMEPIGPNVKAVMSYQNPNATLPSPFGMLGGGVAVAGKNGPGIKVAEININHAKVQFDASLHARTVALVKSLVEA